MDGLARLLVFIFAESYYGYAIVIALTWYARDIFGFAFDIRSIRKEWPNLVGVVNETSTRVVAIEKRLDKMDGRLDKMDGRLDKMDGRLDKIDARLDNMDRRFDDMDRRLARIEAALTIPAKTAAE